MKFNTEINRGSFGRHETFTARYGWLKKGFEAVKEDPNIFTSPNAVEILGVGKNMVKSILFWCLATHIIEPVEPASMLRVGGAMQPSNFGNKLLDNVSGWDSYLEDPASFWLLHMELCMPPIYAASWPILINLASNTFDIKSFTRSLSIEKKKYDRLSKYSEGSLKKDASCFLRTYASNADGKGTKDGEIDCPFRQLNLIYTDKDSKHQFNMDTKPNLPSLIFLAACLKFLRHTQHNGKTLTLNKIAYDFSSPGMLFKVSETQAGHAIETAIRMIDGISFVELQGQRQLQVDEDPEELYLKVLDEYYTEKSSQDTGQ